MFWLSKPVASSLKNRWVLKTDFLSAESAPLGGPWNLQIALEAFRVVDVVLVAFQLRHHGVTLESLETYGALASLSEHEP